MWNPFSCLMRYDPSAWPSVLISSTFKSLSREQSFQRWKEPQASPAALDVKIHSKEQHREELEKHDKVKVGIVILDLHKFQLTVKLVTHFLSKWRSSYTPIFVRRGPCSLKLPETLAFSTRPVVRHAQVSKWGSNRWEIVMSNAGRPIQPSPDWLFGTAEIIKRANALLLLPHSAMRNVTKSPHTNCHVLTFVNRNILLFELRFKKYSQWVRGLLPTHILTNFTFRLKHDKISPRQFIC